MWLYYKYYFQFSLVYSDENLHNSPLFSTLCENENYFGAQVSVLFLLNPSVQIAKKKVFDQTFYFKVLATAAFLNAINFTKTQN